MTHSAARLRQLAWRSPQHQCRHCHHVCDESSTYCDTCQEEFRQARYDQWQNQREYEGSYRRQNDREAEETAARLQQVICVKAEQRVQNELMKERLYESRIAFIHTHRQIYLHEEHQR